MNARKTLMKANRANTVFSEIVAHAKIVAHAEIVAHPPEGLKQ